MAGQTLSPETKLELARTRGGLYAVIVGDLVIAAAGVVGLIYESRSSNNGAEIAAILSGVFTTIGTMTTAFFGIRAVSASNRRRDTPPRSGSDTPSNPSSA